MSTTTKITTIPLLAISPREDNPRLFIEREALTPLVELYIRHAAEEDVVLPDPPIVRTAFRENDSYIAHWGYEILRGHRRVLAASMAGLEFLDCRVEDMSDEEAYLFILDHGERVPLTTIDLAYRAYEMENLGFSKDSISEALGGSSEHRYLAVGAMVDLSTITDTEKLCDPSITLWYEAASHGQSHFNACLSAWNLGLWDEPQCAENFRRRDPGDLPLDNKMRGLRLSVSTDGQWMNTIGRLDAGLLSPTEIARIWEEFKREGDALVLEAVATGSFGQKYKAANGKRYLMNLNPDTLDFLT